MSACQHNRIYHQAQLKGLRRRGHVCDNPVPGAKEVHEVYKRVLGAEHRTTLKTAGTLAFFLWTSEYEDAGQVHEVHKRVP